ncbi:MAG: hypothetical protein MUF38_16525 [Anaerolineae bacterium]|nr:hypothetical protein [Anaerolineae bacterium]
MRRLWVVMCWVVILTVGASAQTPEPPPSVENPRLTIEDGVLTIDDGTGVTMPGVWDDELTDPIIYEQLLYGNVTPYYGDALPYIVGRVNDGTENFFFGRLSYQDEPVQDRAAGWYVNLDLYPDSRLLGVHVSDTGRPGFEWWILGFAAVIGEDYLKLNPNSYSHLADYLGKPIFYLLFDGPSAQSQPLDVSITPDGETLYPTLEAFVYTETVIVDGEERDDLPRDLSFTIMTPEGARITYGNGGFSGDVGLLAWEPVDGRVLEWVEPENRQFTPAVRVDEQVLPLALNGGYVWNVSKTLITDDGRTVRLLKARIPNFSDVEENALYWVELSPLKVVRLTYWNESLTEASLDFLPDASGVLMSAFANFGDGTGGPGVWRLVPGENPVLLTRDVPDGFSDGGMSVPPRLSVNADGFMLTSVSGETSQSYDLDGTPLD